MYVVRLDNFIFMCYYAYVLKNLQPYKTDMCMVHALRHLFMNSYYVYQVFTKGSPLTFDVSKAILMLSENGTLKNLYEEWFSPTPKCKASQNDLEDPDSLSWRSFWGLYFFSAAISTLSYILFAANRSHQLHQGNNNSDHVSQDTEMDNGGLSDNLVIAEPSNDDIQRTTV